MRKKNNEHLFICNNCDHEFYSKRKPSNNRLIECPRCGEAAAYLEEDPLNYNNEYDDTSYDHDEEYIDQEYYDSYVFPDDI